VGRPHRVGVRAPKKSEHEGPVRPEEVRGVSQRTLVAFVGLVSFALLSGAAAPPRRGGTSPLAFLEPSSPVTIAAATELPDFGFPHREVAADPLLGLSSPADPPPDTARRAAYSPVEPSSIPPAPVGLRIVTEGEIGRGDTLASALDRHGIAPAAVDVIGREMRPVFDFRRSQVGDRFRLVQEPDGDVVDFRYRTRPTVSFHLWREGSGFQARREEEELMARVERMAGVVSSTLYDAMVALGESGQLANEFVGIFAWDVDFSRTTRPGDEFSVLYERLYRNDRHGDLVYVRPGRILAARYRSRIHGELEAFYFQPEEGRGGYYRADGSSVERQFLVSPLQSSRITSPYSNARFHPILHITRPHQGIDYAAPMGTPTYAVADGEVLYRGWMGGFGKLVKIRHRNGYVSYYGHLSRFADGLQVGDRVQQKEVIGYVGMTGLATGPHVCFRIKKDGRWLNPLELRSPGGSPVAASDLTRFETVRDLLVAELEGSTLAATNEAL
jgi:murein DD-endopeptidase MepM/ murein hydrolase activator NlpD